MKRRQRQPQLTLISALLLGGVFAGHSHAQCPPRYEITTILPGPNCGIFGTGAVFGKAMNDLGYITGSVYCAFGGDVAFVWYGSGPWQLIPDPPGVTVLDSRGVDITDDGKVLVRINEGNGGGGFVYDGVTSTMLPPAPAQSTGYETYELDPTGQVVGRWGHAVLGPGRSALRVVNGEIELLESILATPSSEARAVNDNGWIAGWMGNGLVLGASAFVLHGEKLANIGVIDGATSVEPNAISNNGTIVGTAWYWDDPVPANRTKRAFVWQNGAFTDLGVRAPWTRSIAYDVNDSGFVVGSLTEPGTEGFLWLDGTMWDLDELVDHPVPFNILSVWDITNKGQILCEAWIEGTGHYAVVLSPVQLPDTDLNDDCVTNVLDLLTLLGLWGDTGGAPNPADFNDDETVNVLDLLTLLGQWGSM